MAMLRKGFIPPAREGWPPFDVVWRMSLEERLALPEAPIQKSLPIWVLDPVYRAAMYERTALLIEQREGPEAAARVREGADEEFAEADRQWAEYLAGRLTL